MQRKDILLQGWRSAYDIEGWYPPLKSALEGLSDEEASWKPSENTHSILELVNHLLFYKDRFLHRISNRAFLSNVTDNEGTFRSLSDPPDESWQQLQARMESVHKEIAALVEKLEDANLDNPAPKEPVGAQLFSLIQHDAYHTGQIILLRKLQGTWPK